MVIVCGSPALHLFSLCKSAVLTDNAPLLDSGVNGTTEVPVEAPDAVVQPADSAPAEGDSEVKDTSAPATTSEAAGGANGTPSTSKRPPNGKRKSTGGVPEHKTKKLNKKKSLPKITHLDAQPGEYYFARLKSYPPWPAIICDEGMLPQSLLTTRPVTTKQADGTYREAYGDGGKRVHERTFPIMFLHTNEL
jgi:PWWP domain